MQATRDPNVPNNNTGIILSIIPVLILVIIYYSSSIENTASIIYYCTVDTSVSALSKIRSKISILSISSSIK